MGEYTPNIKLYKPSIGETEWGDLVNNNFDVLDEQIDSIKKELITMAIKILMNQAVAHAISKDFYSIIADVITLDYPKGFKNTFESVSSPIEYEITIDNSNNPNDLTDYQILLEINNDEQFFEDCNYNKIYLEFYDEDKTTLLNHYVEEWDTENYNAKIWIKVPNIPANSTKKIYLKINVERTEDLSNGEATFDFFDDFEDGDISDWTIYSGPWGITTDAYEGNYAIYKDVNANDDKCGKQFVYDRTQYDVIITLYFKLIENAGTVPDSFVLRDLDTDSGYLFHLGRAGTASSIKTWESGSIGETLASAGSGITANQWYKIEIILRQNGDLVFRDGTGAEITATDSTYMQFDEFTLRFYRSAIADYIIARKYTDPEPTVTYTRNVIPVDYVTVTFDFPEGVDKLLVTTDSDAQNVYYSTDDGNTWNPIEQDTETELPETAYSIKLKFEQATYMRGYAFLTW